jgi:hypothetical protein
MEAPGSQQRDEIIIRVQEQSSSSLSEKELNELYTPTAEEFNLAHDIAHGTAMRIAFLELLKTFQRLGYSSLCTKCQVRSPSFGLLGDVEVSPESAELLLE